MGLDLWGGDNTRLPFRTFCTYLTSSDARRCPHLCINAIAPGFFIGEQNRALLLKPDGSLAERGRSIIDRTLMGRFGEPDERHGTLRWLCNDASRFVTGVVIPVDGGFSAFGGI